jgi:hypothetical protein
MVSKLAEQKVDRRKFLKGAAAALGGATFLSTMVATNFEAAADTGQAYVIVADVVRGSQNPVGGPVCVETSVFKPGEQVVWRAAVFDTKTGQAITDPTGFTVTVTPEGQSAISMAYGAHPAKAAASDQISFWTGAWAIPPNINGKLIYAIDVTGPNGKGQLNYTGFIGKKDVGTFPAPLTVG